MTEFRTRFTGFRTRIDLRIDLPHASVLVDLRITVSVIIACKTVNFQAVENTVRRVLALSR